MFPAPVIAQNAGLCLGGGSNSQPLRLRIFFFFFFFCNFYFYRARRQMALPEVRVEYSQRDHARCYSPIGLGRARWLVMTAENIDAPTALAWGMVEVVAPKGWMTQRS